MKYRLKMLALGLALATPAAFAGNGTTAEHIEARIAKSPVDIERWNPHMINGCAHGGDKGVPYSGPLRPAAGWASHTMPIPGLYQTGGTTHPGGSITGSPGRNAAMVMMRDLGLEFPG